MPRRNRNAGQLQNSQKVKNVMDKIRFDNKVNSKQDIAIILSRLTKKK